MVLVNGKLSKSQQPGGPLTSWGHQAQHCWLGAGGNRPALVGPHLLGAVWAQEHKKMKL